MSISLQKNESMLIRICIHIQILQILFLLKNEQSLIIGRLQEGKPACCILPQLVLEDKI